MCLIISNCSTLTRKIKYKNILKENKKKKESKDATEGYNLHKDQ